jgi:energy-coupling factor transport system ATP-binding protein
MVKLAVTLAQLTRAKLILLDEPFSGLTYVDRVKLLGHLRELGITVVLTVSNLDAYQEEYWTKTYRLDNGLLVEFKPDKLFSLDRAAWLYEELKNGVSN